MEFKIASSVGNKGGERISEGERKVVVSDSRVVMARPRRREKGKEDLEGVGPHRLEKSRVCMVKKSSLRSREGVKNIYPTVNKFVELLVANFLYSRMGTK